MYTTLLIVLIGSMLNFSSEQTSAIHCSEEALLMVKKQQLLHLIEMNVISVETTISSIFYLLMMQQVSRVTIRGQGSV
ncbi:hypothetical protein CGZ75_20635 [Paenibacillus herberti]|uniref:Uncharacterized protein n=1 Tax=Paenibacillus herberti TaxID=1619309 RepID=A0A229NUP6_9BACL|nr:hypothetical protein CGZ75_20635 [Paenibacillus herberti]